MSNTKRGMDFLNKFTGFIKRQELFDVKDRLIIAVSGGLDSIVLCELCRQAGFHFEIAHCNFQLRGEESSRDELFVKSLGEKYQTKVWIKEFDTEKYALENKVSIQVAARELRYEWFNELMDELPRLSNEPSAKSHHQPESKARENLFSPSGNRGVFLLTAHHANDNVETLLMNFFKGTGITGLKGIHSRQGKIIRPLLFAKKEELLKFAAENILSFVEDSSNSSDKYTRNYFRNQLIPSIQKVFPHVEENLMNNIERFKDIEVLYQQAINLNKKNLLEYKGDEVHIPVLKLLKRHPLKTIAYEIIKDYGFTSLQADGVLHLLQSESGKYISSATHKIIRNRKWLIISPHNTLVASNISIDAADKEIVFANGRLTINKASIDNIEITNGSSIAFLDAAEMVFPLLLRKWKQGDYFYPLGMQKKKKLNRFFTDQKISLPDKEKLWVIESNKRIAWIIGRRIDDRFKVIKNTRAVVSIQFNAL